MKQFNLFITIVMMYSLTFAQNFTRSELPTTVDTPWEVTYGPDEHLWITEFGGVVSRVNPTTGQKTVVYAANDYFGGGFAEVNNLCGKWISSGTFGLALHPDFLTPETAYIYFVYTYNSGTNSSPSTKFRIKRLKWDAVNEQVIEDLNIVNNIQNGYDHQGGRLLAVKQNGTPYLFYTLGDLGVSEDNDPLCYSPQSNNPNNQAQNPNTQNGKVHRFNMDGTIPADNPISGNSFYTRGHRNPQGLIYNDRLEIIYDVEHGDRIDDEINVLEKGMNYGWKDVRGYHDGNHPGETDYVNNYTPNASIAGDKLVEPLYSWCQASSGDNWLGWCTVAPSGGDYYGHCAIPEWENSLLVVTLKDGVTTNRQVFQFKLLDNGELAPSTITSPNPKTFFGGDQGQNGRLRDLAISSDGKKIFIVNTGGGNDKITVYTYTGPDGCSTASIDSSENSSIYISPNPTEDHVTVSGIETIKRVEAISQTGAVQQISFQDKTIDTKSLKSGIYFLKVYSLDNNYFFKLIKK